jgi:hypothetical protein
MLSSHGTEFIILYFGRNGGYGTFVGHVALRAVPIELSAYSCRYFMLLYAKNVSLTFIRKNIRKLKTKAIERI